MTGIKDTKMAMIGAWITITILFFLGLKLYPAWTDPGLKKAVAVLFGYVTLMFGLTWKFMWKLARE